MTVDKNHNRDKMRLFKISHFLVMYKKLLKNDLINVTFYWVSSPTNHSQDTKTKTPEWPDDIWVNIPLFLGEISVISTNNHSKLTKKISRNSVTFWLRNWTLTLVTFKWSSSNCRVIWLVDNRIPTLIWLWPVSDSRLTWKWLEKKSFRIRLLFMLLMHYISTL